VQTGHSGFVYAVGVEGVSAKAPASGLLGPSLCALRHQRERFRSGANAHHAAARPRQAEILDRVADPCSVPELIPVPGPQSAGASCDAGTAFTGAALQPRL